MFHLERSGWRCISRRKLPSGPRRSGCSTHWISSLDFTLDPCATHANAKCLKHFTREENGLVHSWQDEVVFMNPPYGREIGDWMAKAHAAALQEGATVVCLVPARTDTAWWHHYAMHHEIRFLRGRLKFGDGKNSAPFPSALVVMRPAAFALQGWHPLGSSPAEGTP